MKINEGILSSLSFESYTCALDSGGPTQYLTTLSGTINCYDYIADDDVVAGHFKIILIDCDTAAEDGYPFYDLFDATAEVEPFSVLFNLDRKRYARGIEMFINDGHQLPLDNLMIIDRVSINPEFRGQGLGAYVIRALTHKFRHGVSVIALRPFPLQFEYSYANENNESAGTYNFNLNEEESTNKIINHYKQNGFVLVSDLMKETLIRQFFNIMISSPYMVANSMISA